MPCPAVVFWHIGPFYAAIHCIYLISRRQFN
jgi:hypothetical protein